MAVKKVQNTARTGEWGGASRSIDGLPRILNAHTPLWHASCLCAGDCRGRGGKRRRESRVGKQRKVRARWTAQASRPQHCGATTATCSNAVARAVLLDVQNRQNESMSAASLRYRPVELSAIQSKPARLPGEDKASCRTNNSAFCFVGPLFPACWKATVAARSWQHAHDDTLSNGLAMNTNCSRLNIVYFQWRKTHVKSRRDTCLNGVAETVLCVLAEITAGSHLHIRPAGASLSSISRYFYTFA